MTFSAIKTAATPYFTYILIGGLIVTSLGGTYVGSRLQKAKNADAIAALNKRISQKDLALNNAANALKGAAGAILEINREAERQIAFANAEAQAFADAANAATAARKAAEKQIANQKKAWDKARKNEACRLLQDTDIVLTCGVNL